MAARWTEAMTEELTRRWAAGESASTIAAALGRGMSRNSVIGKAHRLGLEARLSPLYGGQGAR